MSKKEKIKQLQADLDGMDADYEALARDYNRKCQELYNAERVQVRAQAPEIPTTQQRPNLITGYDRWWDVTVRFWPLSWSGGRWYRFNWRKAGTLTREGQADFGPFSWSWFREVKR